jgi:hypothetical protein
MTFAKAKTSRSSRGYGPAHQAQRRAAIKALIDGDPCARCDGPMYRDQRLELDHNDDRTAYLGLSHRRCNQLAAAKKGGMVTSMRKRARIEPLPTSRNW